MNFNKILLVGSIGIMMIFLSSNRVASILEDQAILCLADLTTQEPGDLVCSLYNMDQIMNPDNRSMVEYQIHNELDTFDPINLIGGPGQ